MTNVAQTVSLLSQMGVFNGELIREFVQAANSSAALHNAATQEDVLVAAFDLSLQLCHPPRYNIPVKQKGCQKLGYRTCSRFFTMEMVAPGCSRYLDPGIGA